MTAPPKRTAARWGEGGGTNQEAGALRGKKIPPDGAEGKGLRYAPQARWRKRNPLAVWAQNALRSAIRRGLVEPQPCEVCGAEKAEGHHPDYDRPAVVVWLCRRHHKAAHKKARPNGRDGGADAPNT